MTNGPLLLVAQAEDAGGSREDSHGQVGLKNDLQHLENHGPNDDAAEGHGLAGVEHDQVAHLQLASLKVEALLRVVL